MSPPESKHALDLEELIQDLLRWFKKNFPVLNRFARGKNKSHKNTNGISWFKADEGEFIQKMWALKAIIENHGFSVEVLKTNKPGYIVYEDDQQVVAES